MSARLPGDVWPNAEQQALLRACLLDGEAAISAWKEWRRSVDVESEFDHGSFRLLPMAYDRLRALGVEDDLMPRLKGIYRRTWYENQKLFHEIAEPLRRLESGGIPTLVLKGVPLVERYYRAPGLRPMADLDVAVRPSDAPAAARILGEAGFQASHRISPRSLVYRHSVDFRDASETEVDLHWHVCFESCDARWDDAFWQQSVPLTFQGIPTRTLCAADMLLHVIVHGVKWNREPSIRWIADAATILRVAGSEVDWDRFLALTESLHVALRVRAGVEYLAGTIGVPLPDQVRAALRALPVTRMERAEYALRLSDRDDVVARPLGLVRLVLVDHWRLSSDRGPLRAALDLPAYLIFRWRLKGLLVRFARRVGLGRRGQGAATP